MLLSTLPKQLITVELGEEGIPAQLEELHVDTVLQEPGGKKERFCYLLITSSQIQSP
jgi:hypothetical protein